VVPTGATLYQNGDLTLNWGQNPFDTSVTASYSTPNAYFLVYKETGPSEVQVGKYYIDPVSTPTTDGSASAVAMGPTHTDQVNGAAASVTETGSWSTYYPLSVSAADGRNLTFTVSAGGTVLGKGSLDQSLRFTFTPNGTPPFVPTSAKVGGTNGLILHWS